MVTFHREETKTTPEIRIDSSRHLFSIQGVSRPEDVQTFYGETLTALEEALKEQTHTSEPFILSFNMYYFNSSSAKFIADIMMLAKEATEKGITCKVRWYYNQDDEGMLEVGEDFSEMAGMQFQYIMIQQ